MKKSSYTKSCHSRKLLSGIFDILSSYVNKAKSLLTMTRAFTLMELMVAVIIIAVLAAVAVPQYKKAVLKSRFSTLMPLAKSVAKGNEVYYLSNGFYADRQDKLDVEGPGTTPEGTQVNVVDSDDYNYVIASRTGLPNKYIVYQKHSPKFAENIHCEAEDKNIPAMELCKSLGGYEIGGSQTDGYVTYVLEGIQGIDDTLPSPLTKLKEQICANISPANCVVDEQHKTITTTECNGTFTANGGGNCIKRTYDDTGTPTDYVRENINCSYDRFSGNTGCYNYKYNEAGKKLPGYTWFSCARNYGGLLAENGECIFGNLVNLNYTGNPSYAETAYYNVAEYDSNDTVTNRTFYFCTEVTAEGECASIVTTTRSF